MNKLIFFIFTMLFCCVLNVSAQKKADYTGKFEFDYGNYVYQIEIKSDSELTWECIKGDEKGAKGTEKVDRRKVAKGIYFVSWTESTGIKVSQVINLKTMKVVSAIADGNERYVLDGTIKRLK